MPVHRLVYQRTADVNALRALLYEHGHVFPAGIRHLNRMTALVADETSDLPLLIREECQDLLVQIAEKTARIAERAKKLSALATHPVHNERCWLHADKPSRSKRTGCSSALPSV